MHRWRLLLCVLLLSAQAQAQLPAARMLHRQPGLSLRALQSCGDAVVWTAGSGGLVGKSLDAGLHWSWMRPAGTDSLDFRSLWAFDARRALVASAGTPAAIYGTRDGGAHWKRLYFSRDPKVFLDGMCFWNTRRGIVLGDPVQGRFLELLSRDGGKRWKLAARGRRPGAAAGEAFFAASNGFLTALPGGRILAVSGGSRARLLEGSRYGRRWISRTLPLKQGSPSSGAFGLDLSRKGNLVVVGGDYLNPEARTGSAALARSPAAALKPALGMPLGYRSSVRMLSERLAVSCGINGVDLSRDAGLHWQSYLAEGYQVLSVSPDGRYLYLAGAAGRIARVSLALLRSKPL